MPTLARSTLAVLSLLFSASTGCSSSSASATAAAGCPELSTSCPSAVPSWSKTIEPIVNASCATSACHGTGGIEATKINLSTYTGVKDFVSEEVTQVNDCLMPNQDAGTPAPPLTAANRQLLLSWLVCGAPNN